MVVPAAFIADSDALGLVRAPPGRPVGGVGIGIIVVDVDYPMVPGNVANASTYDFPVIYRVLHEMPYQRIFDPGPDLCPLVVKAARELESQGARAIVGACGTFAYFQEQVANAVSVPVYMSVLTQLPFILSGLPRSQKLGVVTASDGPMSAEICAQCGITDTSRTVMVGMSELPEFRKLIGNEQAFDHGRLKAELLARLHDIRRDNEDIGAWLLQCSDLPPYAHAIQQEFGLPVFDMPQLMRWLFRSLVRTPYSGFI